MLYLARGDYRRLLGTVVVFSSLKGHGCETCEECLNHDGEELIKYMGTHDVRIYKLATGQEQLHSQTGGHIESIDEMLVEPTNPLLGKMDFNFYWYRLSNPMKEIAKEDVDLIYAGKFSCVTRCINNVMSQMEEYYNHLSEQLDTINIHVRPKKIDLKHVPRAWRN